MIKKVIKSLVVRVNYSKGEDDKGNPIIKGQSFRNINDALLVDDMYLFGEKVQTFIAFTEAGLKTEEEYELLEVAN